MSNNQLPADMQARIKADAIKYVESTRGHTGRIETYIVGATAERSNSQQLIDRLGITLENVYNIHSDQWTEYDRKEIKGILQQWKGKEVGDDSK